jgi:hypothetical protein
LYLFFAPILGAYFGAYFAPIDKNKFNGIEPWLSPLALLLPSAL